MILLFRSVIVPASADLSFPLQSNSISLSHLLRKLLPSHPDNSSDRIRELPTWSSGNPPDKSWFRCREYMEQQAEKIQTLMKTSSIATEKAQDYIIPVIDHKNRPVLSIWGNKHTQALPSDKLGTSLIWPTLERNRIDWCITDFA